MSLVINQPAEALDLAPSGLDIEIPGQVLAGRATTTLWCRKWQILFIALLISGPIGMVIYSLPKYYDAEALLMIDTRKTELSDYQAATSNVSGDTLTIRTQIDILKSPELAGRIVDQLDLVHTPAVQKLLHPDVSAVQFLSVLVERWLGVTSEPPPALTSAEERQIAIAWLADHMTIENDGRSYTVTVRARTQNAVLSTTLANTYADLYLEFMRDLKIHMLQKANFWLDQQITPLQLRLRSAEEAIEIYRERNGLVLNRTSDASSGQSQGVTIADQQLSQINTQLTAARNDLSDKESRLRQAQAALKGGGLDAVPEVVASPLIQRMREQQAELAGRAASLDRSALGSYPAMQAIRASNADLDMRIKSEVSKIIASLDGQVAAAKAHVDSLQQALVQLRNQVTQQSQAEVTLRQLTSEADAARAVYRDFLGRAEQTSSQSALQEPEANLYSRATPPLGPAGPPRSRFMALAVLGSLVVGVIAALGADRLRGGLRTPEQLESETGLFPLGFIPVGRDRGFERLTGRGSAYAKAISHVRSMLRFGDSRCRAQVVLVTSAAPEEGKTVFAISLAASVGCGNGRALLIDAADPASHTKSILTQLGLAKTKRHEVSDVKLPSPRFAIHEQVLPGVDLIMRNSSENGTPHSFESGQLKDLISEARDRYELILIDAPPVLDTLDAALMASVVDGAVMVTRWRHTEPVAIRSALRTLGAYRVRVLGGVLTQVRLNELSKAECGHRLRERKLVRTFA